MKPRRGQDEGTALTFLDTIACGFGAMLMLLLITRPGTNEPEPATDGGGAERVQALMAELFGREEEVARLESHVEEMAARTKVQETRASLLDQAGSRRETQQGELEAALAELVAGNRGIESSVEQLKRISVGTGLLQQRDDEVGGIPVDSDHVIFIIDTSGSMKRYWDRVLQEIGNVLDIHPAVAGFQVLNDNGGYLVSGYKGRWIPDNPSRRRSVMRVLQSWNAVSNSSPVEGLQTALRAYGARGDKVAIYIFGDDYSGGSYDEVLGLLDGWRARYPKAQVRVHAVGIHPNERFTTLMRAVTERNDGTMLALPR